MTWIIGVVATLVGAGMTFAGAKFMKTKTAETIVGFLAGFLLVVMLVRVMLGPKPQITHSEDFSGLVDLIVLVESMKQKQ